MIQYFKKIIITFVLICSCFFFTGQVLAVEITYDVHHYPQKLHITLQFTGSEKGVTKIAIPSRIWGHNLGKQIKNIQISDKTITQEASGTLIHKPNQIIKLSYDIVNVDVAYGNSYYTYCERDGFFFLHDFALIYPELQDQQDAVLQYHSQKAKQFFCLGEKVQIGEKIITSLKELKGGFSISGNDAILQSTKLHNMPILGFNVSCSNFINVQQMLSIIIESQKNLCNCQVKDNAIIFIGNKSTNQRYRGSLLEHNQILFLISDIIDDLEFKNLSAHENFHKYIGKGPIRYDPKDGLTFKWFFEGFTDYFALKTNLISKNITLQQYLSTYNRILENYFASPYKSLAYDQASIQYWQNGRIKQMIYDRGHIMAQELDLEIGRVSNKTLQDVLCEMLNIFQKDAKLTFSKNVLIEVIKTVTKYDLTSKINSLIDGDINLTNILSNIAIENNASFAWELFMVPQYKVKTSQSTKGNVK
jgi:hypothetical protein